MLARLAVAPAAEGSTVVLDAGIASEENIAWLRARGYRYLAVSRERHKVFDAEQATLIREEGATRIRVQRLVDADTGEVRLYCHSTGREAKERGIAERFSTGLEAALDHLAEGLHRKGRVKRYEKVLTRIGRLRQRYARVARYYDIRVEKDETSGNAKALSWSRITPTEDTLPGVYCLRTNQAQWDDATLWHTYTMLTELEIYQPCCLRKTLNAGCRRRRWTRRRGSSPSAVAPGVAHVDARARRRRPKSATAVGRHAEPGGPAASPCAAS